MPLGKPLIVPSKDGHVMRPWYEVLSNPEVKQCFNNGDDSVDSMAGQGGSPFTAGEDPFAHLF